jgi:chromosome partitioning protein
MVAGEDLAEKGSLLERVWQEVQKTSTSDWSVKLIAAIIVAAMTPWIVRLVKRFAGWLKKTASCSRRLAHVREAVGPKSRGIWLNAPIEPPDSYEQSVRTSKPIIVLANLKGGVGKTTTAANLAAHYSIKKSKRVLLIDLDFQGSLSSMALAREQFDAQLAAQAEFGQCKASKLISVRDSDWLANAADGVQGVPKASVISGFYSLASTENRLMVEWLLDPEANDIRYNLAVTLHAPRIQNAFDLIIIDAPPRLTTACVQGLCAATHVLIPTILDEMSAASVATFADQLVAHEALWPRLKVLGVVGTMTTYNPVRNGELVATPVTDTENLALSKIRDQLSYAVKHTKGPLSAAEVLPETCLIPDKAEIGRAAGNRIAYARTAAAAQEIREIFDRLGDEIDRRITGGS